MEMDFIKIGNVFQTNVFIIYKNKIVKTTLIAEGFVDIVPLTVQCHSIFSDDERGVHYVLDTKGLSSAANADQIVCNLFRCFIAIAQIIGAPMYHQGVGALFDDEWQHMVVKIPRIGAWKGLDVAPGVAEMLIKLTLPYSLHHAVREYEGSTTSLCRIGV